MVVQSYKQTSTVQQFSSIITAYFYFFLLGTSSQLNWTGSGLLKTFHLSSTRLLQFSWMRDETFSKELNHVIGDSSRWYKQSPGGVPQYILRFYHSWDSPRYGSGFSSPKFTSNHQSQSDYRLIINNVQEGDSAVYYCHTWDSSASQFVSQ
uniref:Immunoglobulin V-set domain-containing protein n=1 Tax=Sphaeramia orbicularis TaxID=375764 RepID=A0A672YDN5_9TELE